MHTQYIRDTEHDVGSLDENPEIPERAEAVVEHHSHAGEINVQGVDAVSSPVAILGCYLEVNM